MEYLSDIREFKLLRNYINNDPVCDFFEFQIHMNNSYNFEKDTNNYFNKYVNKVSSDYINEFFKAFIMPCSISDLVHLRNCNQRN